jgi:hypothetical protein
MIQREEHVNDIASTQTRLDWLSEDIKRLKDKLGPTLRTVRPVEPIDPWMSKAERKQGYEKSKQKIYEKVKGEMAEITALDNKAGELYQEVESWDDFELSAKRDNLFSEIDRMKNRKQEQLNEIEAWQYLSD